MDGWSYNDKAQRKSARPRSFSIACESRHTANLPCGRCPGEALAQPQITRMRVFGGAFSKRLTTAAQLAAGQPTRVVAADAAECAATSMQSVRAFSAAHLRSRSTVSPWERQTAKLSASSSAMAAAAAWTTAVQHQEAHQVEDWLTALHQVDSDTRSVCQGLLARHPDLVWRDPTKISACVQVLVDATRQRHLLKSWMTTDANILAIADRYTPEGLRSRLADLHRQVWQKLDDANVTSLFAPRSSLDMLDLEARALARKAERLRLLVPEFLPSTVLRACPELLDVPLEDLPAYVRRAGDVVIIGANTTAELVDVNNVVVVRCRQPPSPAASFTSSFTPSAGRLLRTARCGAQQLLQEEAAPSAAPEVVRVFCNTRSLVFATPEGVELRVEDPTKSQEDLGATSAVPGMAALKGTSSSAVATETGASKRYGVRSA